MTTGRINQVAKSSFSSRALCLSPSPTTATPGSSSPREHGDSQRVVAAGGRPSTARERTARKITSANAPQGCARTQVATMSSSSRERAWSS